MLGVNGVRLNQLVDLRSGYGVDGGYDTQTAPNGDIILENNRIAPRYLRIKDGRVVYIAGTCLQLSGSEFVKSNVDSPRRIKALFGQPSRVISDSDGSEMLTYRGIDGICVDFLLVRTTSGLTLDEVNLYTEFDHR